MPLNQILYFRVTKIEESTIYRPLIDVTLEFRSKGPSDLKGDMSLRLSPESAAAFSVGKTMRIEIAEGTS